MNEVVFIKGEIIDEYDDLAWDKKMMKFEFKLPDGTTYVTNYLSSNALIASDHGLYWGISYEAWLTYDVTAKKIGTIYRNENGVSLAKWKLEQDEKKRIKRERAKRFNSNYVSNSTIKKDEDYELEQVEKKYFNNNDYTFW